MATCDLIPTEEVPPIIIQTALAVQNPTFRQPNHLYDVSGKVGRQPYNHPNDDFVQPGNLYRKVMTDQDRDHLIGNIVSHLCNAKKDIQIRQAIIFFKADPEYGQRVAEGLGINL